MMYLSKRTKKLLILFLILLIAILLMLFFWVTRAPEVEETFVPSEVVSEEQKQEEAAAQEELAQEEQKLVSEASVRSLSDAFTERYGSYSTESHFANLSDVMVLMSDRFAAETEAFLETATISQKYYAVTTQVLSVSVDTIDEEQGIASATVSTQREEAIGTLQDSQVSYQTVVLELIWENGGWKVDVATWQ